MKRSVFGLMKVEELEKWYEENKDKLEMEERRYVENVMYRKRYNSVRWKKMKVVENEIKRRFE